MGQHSFSLEGMHWEQLRIGGKSEAEYLAGKDAEQQQSFQTDKAGFQERFVAQLATRAQGVELVPTPPGKEGVFTIRATVTYFEPGFYVGVAARDSEVDITPSPLWGEGGVRGGSAGKLPLTQPLPKSLLLLV